MAKIVSLMNMKSRVGKSTLTINLAWYFVSYTGWSKKVLVIDLDPQFQVSQYLLGATKYERLIREQKLTIKDIFAQQTKTLTDETILALKETFFPVVRIRGGARIDLIPSCLELAQLIKDSQPGKEYFLTKILKPLEKNYDLILIDCSPSESVLTTAAYLSSEFILVPVRPEFLSTIGLPLLAHSMADFSEKYGVSQLAVSGIVFNAVLYRSLEEEKVKEAVKKVAEQNKWYIFSNEVNYSIFYSRGAVEGRAFFRTSYPKTKQAQQFESFAEEFARRIF